MKEFRIFYNQILSANRIDSYYQCTLITEVYKHLKQAKIKFEEIVIVYNCKKDTQILVPVAVQAVDIS